MWYCRHEIQLRQAMFFSAASIAGAFSGLLAFAISKMDGTGGLEGWRWIFILEGIVTVIVAVFAFWALHDFPETAKFLTEEERAFVVYRLKYQGQVQGKSDNRVQVAEADDFQWKYVWDAFTDWQIWINIFVYWGVSKSPGHGRLFTNKADCLPPIRHQSFPAHDYPKSQLYVKHRSAHDRSYLHHRRDSRSCRCLSF